MEAFVLDGQSLLDIAIQETGTIEGVFDIAVKNNISITDILHAGYTLTSDIILNEPIQTYYRIRHLTPATELKTNLKPKAIGSMTIGVDFTVY